MWFLEFNVFKLIRPRRVKNTISFIYLATTTNCSPSSKSWKSFSYLSVCSDLDTKNYYVITSISLFSNFLGFLKAVHNLHLELTQTVGKANFSPMMIIKLQISITRHTYVQHASFDQLKISSVFNFLKITCLIRPSIIFLEMFFSYSLIRKKKRPNDQCAK